MSNPCVIIEWSEATDWAGLFSGLPAHAQQIEREPLRIPSALQPAMLQPDRITAEAKAMRLAQAHPHKRFAIFEARVESRMVDIPSHVNIKGDVWMARRAPVIVEIDDDEVPF